MTRKEAMDAYMGSGKADELARALGSAYPMYDTGLGGESAAELLAAAALGQLPPEAIDELAAGLYAGDEDAEGDYEDGGAFSLFNDALRDSYGADYPEGGYDDDDEEGGKEDEGGSVAVIEGNDPEMVEEAADTLSTGDSDTDDDDLSDEDMKDKKKECGDKKKDDKKGGKDCGGKGGRGEPCVSDETMKNILSALQDRRY